MSPALLITINVLAAAVLLVGLAYAMSRTMLLKPHTAAPRATAQSSSTDQALVAQRPRRSTRTGRPTTARRPAAISSHAGPHAAAAHES